ncbi:hypothetical protein NEOLEDRAFT_1173273 [Neolentinus lepideus HHB14362 ss-1]|uniref:F-box domain-containing protein n=1 Tax=Neolentinus lepideus HHB14362 ss-1 TaxID=1314782 RepID=A0A165N0U7_9AGAM|nr:hypothetical protein NEOLEDRAFT_1173273 [Neolentinus lepideus HHB14362 ss-1]
MFTDSKRVITSHTKSGFEKPLLLLDPVDGLPTEVVVEIWRICIAEEARDMQGNPPFPFVASSVSRRWRKLALTTSPLWTNVYIDRYSKLGPVQLQLARSGRCLLDLVIYFVSDPEEPIESVYACEPLIRDFMHRVATHADRWRSLDFTIYGARSDHGERNIDTALAPLRNLKAPFLNELSLTLCFEYPRCGPLFTGGTPALDTLYLNGLDMRGIRNLFTRLTVLEITEVPLARRPTFNEFLANLRACSESLEHLSISGPCFLPPPAFPLSKARVIFPSLVSLSLSFGDEAWDRTMEEAFIVSAFFNSVSSPRLQDLALADLSHLGAEAVIAAHDDFAVFPSLSNLSLRNVNVLHPEHERDPSLPFLLCFPMVDTLELVGGDGARLLACLMSNEWITYRGPVQPGLRLKTLVCARISPPCDLYLLHQFIADRQAAGHAIATLYVDRPAFDKTDSVILKRLCGQADVVLESYLEP